MVKILLSFVLCFIFVFFGIKAFRALSDKERWSLTKLAAYAILCSAISIAILVSVVILF